VSSVAASLTVSQIAQQPLQPGPADLIRVVAVDGPAGTGKSTVSRQLARALGWRFVDTGATYRAATLAVLRAGVDPQDGAEVLAVVARARIALVTDPASPTILLDEHDVAAQIRNDQVTGQVSAVSSFPAVRELLIAVQRDAMGTAGAVVEGRDIATVVAPLAGLKVYLDARPEVRARRRATDVVDGGHVVDGGDAGAFPRELLQIEEAGFMARDGATASGRSQQQGSAAVSSMDDVTAAVARSLILRDSLDSMTNKLQVSEGAVHVDTSDLTLDQVVAVLRRLVAAAGLQERGPGE
jgi:cytidylate kinase